MYYQGIFLVALMGLNFISPLAVATEKKDPNQIFSDFCQQSLESKNRRAFEITRENPNAPNDLWNDFIHLLESAKQKKFYSLSSSKAVYSKAFKNSSWMIPNPSLHFHQTETFIQNLNNLKPISFAEHLANIKLLKSQVRNNNEGLFGPHSVLWRVVSVAGDVLNFGGVNYLQLAHPVGAQGVFEHSQLLSKPLDRMRRTAKYIFQIIYDPWETVEKVSIGVFKGHGHIKGLMPETLGRFEAGRPYEALEPEALLWVYATRFIAWLDAYEVLSNEPLDDFEREQVYQESKLFALAFGIPLNALPRTFSDFYHYYQYMLHSKDQLAVGSAALAVRGHFQKLGESFLTAAVGTQLLTMSYLSIGPTLLIYNMVKKGIENMAAYYMPPHLNHDFGFHFSKNASDINAGLTKKILLDGMAPRGLMTLPAWQIAMARVTGKSVPREILDRHALITGEK